MIYEMDRSATLSVYHPQTLKESRNWWETLPASVECQSHVIPATHKTIAFSLHNRTYYHVSPSWLKSYLLICIDDSNGSPKDIHVEALLQIAEIFADLQLAETFTTDKKVSDGTGTVFHKPLLDQVTQTKIWVPDRHASQWPITTQSADCSANNANTYDHLTLLTPNVAIRVQL